MKDLVQGHIKYQGRISEILEEGQYCQFAVLFPDNEKSLKYEKSVEKIIVALEGSGEFFVDGDKVNLQKGDILIILTNREHFIADKFETDTFRFNVYSHHQ